MRPRWKKVAEYAGNEAFPLEDVRDAIVVAVEQDWRKDVSPGVIGCIQDVLGGATMFSEDSLRALEDLRPSVAGGAMGAALLGYMAYAVNDGKSGDAALQEAATYTLTDWLARRAYQIEEHYLRKSSTPATKSIRSRIEEAIQQVPFTVLASRLLDPESTPALRLEKHDGLDDGVPL